MFLLSGAPGVAPAAQQGSPIHQAAGADPQRVMPASQSQPGIPNAVIPTSRGMAASHMVPPAQPASTPGGYPASAANQSPMVTMAPTQPYQSPMLPQAPVQVPPHMAASAPAMQPHIPAPRPAMQPHVPAPNAQQGPPTGHNMVLRQDSTNTVSAVDTPIAAAGQQTMDGHASRHHGAILAGHPVGQYPNSRPSQMYVASNNPEIYASGVHQHNYQSGMNIQQLPPANQPQGSLSGPGQHSIPNLSSVPSAVSQYNHSNIGYYSQPSMSNQSISGGQSISNMGGSQPGQQMPHLTDQYVQPSSISQVPPSVSQYQNYQATSQQSAPMYQTPSSQAVASQQQQYVPGYQAPTSAYPDSGSYPEGVGRPNAGPPVNVSQQAGGSPQHKPMYNTQQQPQQYVNQQQPQYSNLQQPQQQTINPQQPLQQTINPQQPQQQMINPQQSQQYSQQIVNQQSPQVNHQQQSQQSMIQQQQPSSHQYQQQHNYPGVLPGQGQMSPHGMQHSNQQQQPPTQNMSTVSQPQQVSAVHPPQQPGVNQLRTSQNQSPQIYGQQNVQGTSQMAIVNQQESSQQQNINMQAGLQAPYIPVQNQSPGSNAVMPQQTTMASIPNQQQVYSNQSNNAQNIAGPQQGLPPNQAYQQQPNTNLQGQVGYNTNLPSNQIVPGQSMQNALRPVTFQPVMTSQGQQMYPSQPSPANQQPDSGTPGVLSQNASGQQQAFILAQGPSQMGANISGAMVQGQHLQPMGPQGVSNSTTPMVPKQAAMPQTSSVSAMPMDLPASINSSANILKPAKLHRQNSDPNASSLDDILSSSPENARDATIPNPVLTPKVLTAQEIQQQKEEAMKTQRKQPPKDPYQDKEVLSRFVAEVEKFEKTMSTLSTPTLKGTSHLDVVWKVSNNVVSLILSGTINEGKPSLVRHGTCNDCGV